MFKGLYVAICLALTLLVLPGIAWSEPDVQNFPIAPKLVPYSFPARLGGPDANKLLNEVNEARQNAGVQPLRANKQLSLIAEQRAADMSVRQYYSHKSPEGHLYYDFMDSYGLNPDYSCENLDLVFEYSDPLVVADWLNSPKGHKQCMLNQNAYETGIAVVPYGTAEFNGQRNTVYLVVAIHSTSL